MCVPFARRSHCPRELTHARTHSSHSYFWVLGRQAASRRVRTFWYVAAATCLRFRKHTHTIATQTLALTLAPGPQIQINLKTATGETINFDVLTLTGKTINFDVSLNESIEAVMQLVSVCVCVCACVYVTN